MALEWVVLTYAVVAEAILVFLLTLPGPDPLRKGLTTLTKNILKPVSFIVPFSLFLLCDIYWKYEHRPPSCLDDPDKNCSHIDMLIFEKAAFKGHRNIVLVFSALVLYWVLYSLVKHAAKVDEMKDQIEKLKKHVD